MQNKNSTSIIGSKLSIISFGIPIVILISIGNWFFQITPFQRLEGLPLMIIPFLCPIGIILGIISIKIAPNKLAKYSIILNLILFALPFLYWFLGTLLLGV